MELNFLHTRRYKWALILNMGVFFYLFLAFFLPFGVSNYDPNHEITFTFLLQLSYFTLMVCGTAAVMELGLKPFFARHYGHSFYILWTLILLSIEAIMVFLVYNWLGDWHDWRLESALEFQINVSSVLIFPIIGTYFYYRYKVLKHHYNYILTQKKDADFPMNQMITFKGQGAKDRIILSLNSFLYAQSQDNYVEIFYKEDDQIRKKMIRATLSGIEESVEPNSIARIHRSYMVNLIHVHALKGGDSDLKLSITGVTASLPVSKSYRESLLSELKKVKTFVNTDTHPK